ncbi:hypothetical protein PFISCL1PPCAC_9849, partial [Pristionchus fissidentatus]
MINFSLPVVHLNRTMPSPSCRVSAPNTGLHLIRAGCAENTTARATYPATAPIDRKRSGFRHESYSTQPTRGMMREGNQASASLTQPMRQLPTRSRPYLSFNSLNFSASLNLRQTMPPMKKTTMRQSTITHGRA